MVRKKIHTSLPDNVMKVNSIFREHNYEVFLVGGCVRDLYLGLEPKDYDFVTNLLPDEIELMFQKDGYKTIPTGKQFGIINVIVDGEEFEIATYRVDSVISDGRRPESVTFSTIDKDSTRRDLTINSLYYDIENQEVIDYQGGIGDIDNGIIRTVGDPYKRFEEDNLRVLRIGRFLNRFDFKLDQELHDCLMNGSDLSKISLERVRDEFLKGINTTKSVEKYFNTLTKFGLWKWIFGDFKINLNHNFEHKHYIVVLSLLLDSNNPNDLKKRLVSEYKYSILEVNSICFFLRFKQDISVNNVFKLKTEYERLKIFDSLFYEFCESSNLDMTFVEKFINFNLTVSGDDLIKQGYKGKEVGRIKEELENQNFLNH